MTDAINPSHYKHLPVEAIDIIEAAIAKAPSNEAACLHWQVLKYTLRCWEKKGIEDLRKAQWYLDRLVNRDQLAEVAGAIPDLPIEEPKPSRTQPPSGYRLLGDAKIEPRCADDLYWSDSHKNWAPIGFQMSYANAHNWAACRKIEEPEKPWRPKIGERVVLKATGAIYRIASYNDNSKQYSMEGWPGSCVNLENIAPWFENEEPPKRYREPPNGWRWIEVGEVFCGTDSTNTVDAVPSAWAGTVCAVKHVAFRKIEEPPERYREPTQADLANGPIECEYRDDDDEQWRRGFLVYMIEGHMPFLCVSKDRELSGQWIQCRIEVQE